MLTTFLFIFILQQIRVALTAPTNEVHPPVQVLHFEATSSKNANGRRIISINGHSDTYGPTIRASVGDNIRLNLKNSICSPEELLLSETDPLWQDYCNTALHFHGLAPIGNANDGVPGLIQPAIKGGEEYWYNFTIPENACGTFWYHSHSTVQYGDGLRGIILVDCPEFTSLADSIVGTLGGGSNTKTGPLTLTEGDIKVSKDAVQEEVIALSDWYDDFDLDILHDKVMAYDGTTDPRIDGSLINGSEDDNHEFQLRADTEALVLRILNTGMSGTQVLNLAGHKLVIMETDGILVKPFVVETLSLAVGQRITAVVKLNGDVESGDSALKLANGCNKMMGYIEKVAWFTKEGGQNLRDMSHTRIKNLPGLDKNELYQELEPTDSSGISGLWDASDIQRVELDYSYHSDDNTVDEFGTGMYKVNDKTFGEYLKDPIKLKGGQITEIIINSVDHMRHPWHLHGQPFQVVSIGTGHEGPLRAESPNNSAGRKYNQDLQLWRQTKRTPMTRDSINIPGSSYAALRIKADAPGLWLLHCHVDWHIAKGLGVVLQVLPQLSDETPAAVPTATPAPIEHPQPPRHRIRVLAVYIVIMLAINGVLYWLLM